MLRRITILTAVVLVFSACELQAEVINSRWIGGAHGGWEVPSNWEPPIVPNNSDSQTFDVTISGDVKVGLAEDHVIDQLDCYGNVELTKYRDWISLKLEDPNGLRNYGHLRTEIEMMHIHENLDNSEGCTIEMCGSIEDEGDGNVENAGLIIIPTMSRLLFSRLYNVGQIVVFGGTCAINDFLDNDSNGIIKGWGGVGGTIFLKNKGKIYATGGGLGISINGLFSNKGFIGNAPVTSVNVMHVGPISDANNLGTIEVNAGGGVAFDCNLVNEPNGIIKLLGGTLAATTIKQAAGASFEGFGGITGNVVIDPDGIIRLTGPTNIVGDVTIEENAELEISDGLVIVTCQTDCNGTIRIKGGRIVPQGGLSGDCNIIYEPSDYDSMEDLAILTDTWLWQVD